MVICQNSTICLRRLIIFMAAASISASEVPARKIGATPVSSVVIAILLTLPLRGFAGAAIAGLNLLAEILPDRLAVFDEVLLVADFRDDARARQVDLVDR